MEHGTRKARPLDRFPSLVLFLAAIIALAERWLPWPRRRTPPEWALGCALYVLGLILFALAYRHLMPEAFVVR